MGTKQGPGRAHRAGGGTGRSGSALAVVSALEQAACGSLQGVRGCEDEERGSKDRFSR